jgi:hypothetical protein
VDDVRHAVRVDQRLERGQVGHVTAHARHALELGRVHHERHPARVVADVVGDHVDVAAHQIADDPRPDAPVGTGDQDACHRRTRPACGAREPI